MRLPSKTTTFWVLLAASGVSAFLLPASWTTPGRGLFQPLVLLQWPTTWFAHKTAESVEGTTSESLSAEQATALRREVNALQRQVINQRLRLREAERQLEEVTGLAAQMPDSHASIIVAPVVSYDASPRRETLQIALKDAGWRRLRQGREQWVVAAVGPTPDWDKEATLRDLLHRGWLIGRICELHPRVARVQLATDPAFRCAVRAARVLEDGTIQATEEGCMLEGQGSGRLRINQAIEDYYETGWLIVIAPTSRELPVPMTLGRITGSRPRDDSAQHFDLDVVPWGRTEMLTHVYVIAPN